MKIYALLIHLSFKIAKYRALQINLVACAAHSILNAVNAGQVKIILNMLISNAKYATESKSKGTIH